MPTQTPSFVTVGGTFTLGLATGPLASDGNLVAGREGTAIDQKDTLDAIDVHVGFKVSTGTSPTASRQIDLCLYGSVDDSTFSGSATGSDANLTPDSRSNLAYLDSMIVDSTSNKAYRSKPFSVAQAFGGFVPVQFGPWVVHNTGVALNGTGGNHGAYYTTIKLESA